METGEGICKANGFDYTRNDDNTDIISLPCQNQKENECQQIQGFNEETLEFYSYPNCNEKEEKEVICQEMDYANCKEKGEETLRENICKNNLDFNAENYNSCQEMNEKESECQQMTNGYTNYEPIEDEEGNILKQSCQVARESEIKCKNLSDFEGINYKSCIDMKAGENNCKTLSFIDGENYLSCEQARAGETICQEGIDLEGNNYMQTDDKTACDIAKASEESCRNMTNVDGERYELNDDEGKCAQVRTFCRNKKGLDNNNYASCSEYELGENNCKNMKNFEGQNYSSCLEARPQEEACNSMKDFLPIGNRRNYTSCTDARNKENLCKTFKNMEGAQTYNSCDEATTGEDFCKSKKSFNPYESSEGKEYSERFYTSCADARRNENFCKSSIPGIAGMRVYEHTKDTNGNITKTRCENAKEAEEQCKQMKDYNGELYEKTNRFQTYCASAGGNLRGENFCKGLKNYEGINYNSCEEARPQEEICRNMIDKNGNKSYEYSYKNKLQGEGGGKRYFSACENAKLSEEACKTNYNVVPLYDAQGNMTKSACQVYSEAEALCKESKDIAGDNYDSCQSLSQDEDRCRAMVGIDGITKYESCAAVKDAIFNNANLNDTTSFPVIFYLPKTRLVISSIASYPNFKFNAGSVQEEEITYISELNHNQSLPDNYNGPEITTEENNLTYIDPNKLLNFLQEDLKLKCRSNTRNYKSTLNYLNCMINELLT